MIELRIATEHTLARCYREWDRYGNWDTTVDFVRDMQEPKWLHVALVVGGEEKGLISLERFPCKTVRCHISTARKAIHPQALADVLREITFHLFETGNALSAEALVPVENKAASRLAIRAGLYRMRDFPPSDAFPHGAIGYGILKSDIHLHENTKNSRSANAL